MKNKTIIEIEKKLEEEVAIKKPKKVKYVEIVDIIRATTTFHAIISMISDGDKNITVSDLKNNSKLLTNVFINLFRLNDRPVVKKARTEICKISSKNIKNT